MELTPHDTQSKGSVPLHVQDDQDGTSRVKPSPNLTTNVDDPSHPFYRYRRTVNDFDYGRLLGEGSYAMVKLARDKSTQKLYAIKILPKAHLVKNKKIKYAIIERDALTKMDHPGIIKLKWTFQDNHNLYYVLSLAEHKDLYTYIMRTPFDIPMARFYAAEIVLALDHIHSKGVIHRDIKPENILLDEDMHIKITDFGSAKIIQSGETETPENKTADDTSTDTGPRRSFVGTAEYVSPELLRSDEITAVSDLWALGCIIFQMLSGQSPFKAPTDYLVFQKVKNLDYEFPEDFDPAAKDLVQKLLCPNPKERLGSTGIDAVKTHPFFQGLDWDHVFDQQNPPLKGRLPAEPTASDLPFDGVFSDENDHWLADIDKVIHNPFSDAMATSDAALPMSTYPQGHPLASLDHTSTITSMTYKSDMERLGQQSHPSWMPHLYPNESIVRAGRVVRRRGLLSKKRFLVLTDRPRLLYFDEGSREDGSGGLMRCEIPWSAKLVAELKGTYTFSIHTPEKIYTFEAQNNQAQDWVNTINRMIVDHYGAA